MQKEPQSWKDVHDAFSGPAIFVNRFLLSAGPIVRIAFGETFDIEAPMHYRVGVAMSIDDARELATILNNMLALAPTPNVNGVEVDDGEL